MKKPALLYFSLLALATITLMLFDYHRAPYVQERDYRGSNIQYSQIIYPAAVIIEFLLIGLSINIFQRKTKLIYKIGICLSWVLITFFAFIDTMRGGGIIAAHALWLLVVSISLAILLIVKVVFKKSI